MKGSKPPIDPARALSPDAVRGRIELLRKQLQTAAQRAASESFASLLKGREAVLDRIQKECDQPPEVVISLVGGTGAGKSTLLNALLGARVLPISNMRACTAAISEVGYRADGRFSAEVRFISRADWQRECDLLLADYADAKVSAAETDGDDEEKNTIPRAARDKLWVVYRQTPQSDPASFDPTDLQEPPEITKALDGGSATIDSANLEDFRKSIDQYLNSQSRFWPIVQTVVIRGPFEALKNGVTIVDLPGINDPNEAREQVTRRYLKTCRFVWIVFNIKRVLTKDTMSLMQSDDFLRQVVMDGRSGALTFVGTASDDIDPETGREEFNLAEDTSDAQVVLARNQAVRHEVNRQLDELSARLAHLAGEDGQRSKALAEMFRKSGIFAISAREYMRIRGLSKTREAGLTTEDQTEIPLLRKHMDKISEDYGIEARALAHHRQLDLLVQEIRQAIEARKQILKERSEISQKRQKEVAAETKSADDFLETRLKDAHERYAQALDADQAVLGERLKRGFDRAALQLESVIHHWQSIHWATLRAVARRGGAYHGSTGLHDLPADLSKAVLDSIAFAWVDFFNDKLAQSLERWSQHLMTVADTHRNELLKTISRVEGPDRAIGKSFDGLAGTTEKVLNELLAQVRNEMTQKIESVQRTLYDEIPRQIAANMAKAFEDAAQQSGTGMKKRMVEILGKHARQVSQVMFNDAQDKIAGGVRGLADWLNGKFINDMSAAVRRQAKIASANLGSAISTGSAKQNETEIQALESVQMT
jgi:hypothetical protein